MKRKNWLIWMLTLCLLAGCFGGALAENLPPEGETAAAVTEETRESAAAGTEEPLEQAEEGTEEPDAAAAAENEAAEEPADAGEEEEPRVKPVAEDPQGENWARYISEKILPALEPTLTEENFVFTLLPLHGQKSGNATYGTKFQFSLPEEGAILGSMHVHFAGSGDGKDYRNMAVPFTYRHFFPLTNYLIGNYQETALPISAEAVRAYSLDKPYNCMNMCYFHQVYEGKDWQIMPVCFSGKKEDGIDYSLDGKRYVFLVIQDLANPQPLGFYTTENYLIADQDMVAQIEDSVLKWELLPEVSEWNKKANLVQWLNERFEGTAAEKPENETGMDRLAGEWKTVATYASATSVLNRPLTMLIANLSADGTGTLSFNSGESEEISWETEENRVIIHYHAGERKLNLVADSGRLYLGAGKETIEMAYILVRPDDPLYYRVYRYGDESDTNPYDFVITAKENPGEVLSGKTLTFKAEFEHSDTVNPKAKNNQVSWNVSLPDGSGAEQFAGINDKGVLTVAKDLTERVQLDVRAASRGGTTAVYRLEAVPALKELKIEPDQVVLYLGESKGMKLKVTADPAAAMPKKLNWSNNNKAKYLGLGFASELRRELGVSAKAVGKTVITVKDPVSGKSAKATVTVLSPVTSVTVTGPSTVKAGKSAAYKAALEPGKDIDKTVIWTVDADESIASVSAKGQLKVAKNAPAGTVIRLTARAQGTENEVLDTIEITVE